MFWLLIDNVFFRWDTLRDRSKPSWMSEKWILEKFYKEH